jgi:xanthine dehydrogenase accessory factor
VVTQVEGSAPREPGARMIVADGSLAWGTIGGGKLEHLAIEKATELLADPTVPSETVTYPLAEKTGQCCGGRVHLFFEPLRWVRHTVAIFGAGHVGQSLASLAPWMAADVRVFDERLEADIRPTIPVERPYELFCIDSPEAEVDALPPDALVLVMTHSHGRDQMILERALARGGFPYLGLIGSERKWQRFRQRLRAKGVSDEELDTVRCPIGLSRGSKAPSAIALSTATELVEVMARIPAPSADRSRA